jgi:hypothetical protein
LRAQLAAAEREPSEPQPGDPWSVGDYIGATLLFLPSVLFVVLPIVLSK